jgi:hypothetical protein
MAGETLVFTLDKVEFAEDVLLPADGAASVGVTWAAWAINWLVVFDNIAETPPQADKTSIETIKTLARLKNCFFIVSS